LLFGYPVEATEDNWVHDCLCEIIATVHRNLQANEEPLSWPEIIPEQYRSWLSSRSGLKKRLETFRETLATLDPDQRNQVLHALNSQNMIGPLLSCECDCAAISDLPVPIRAPAKDFFNFSFKLLTGLGIRDHQYSIIYNSISDHVCPFCGCEYFDAPGAPREAMDHYLPESKYPFSAANLRNLVPMGNKCNSRYKIAQDILFSDAGIRRRSFDPYNHDEIRISLNNSILFSGKNGELPLWKIDFDPNNEEVNTWDNVFHIRERYERDVLDPSFMTWLRGFRDWYRAIDNENDSAGKLKNAIQSYCSHYEGEGFSDRGFLKAAFFRMLLKHCEEGNERLITILMDLKN